MIEPTMALARPPCEPGAGVDLSEDVEVQPAARPGSAATRGSPPRRSARCAVTRPAEGHEDQVRGAPARRARSGGGGHRRGSCRPSSSRASASTAKVIRNSTRPRAIRAASVHVAGGLGELVGDGRGDGRAGVEQRLREAVRVADDEGHRHGLAERAAEAQHHRADGAGADVGQGHLASPPRRWSRPGRRRSRAPRRARSAAARAGSRP